MAFCVPWRDEWYSDWQLKEIKHCLSLRSNTWLMSFLSTMQDDVFLKENRMPFSQPWSYFPEDCLTLMFPPYWNPTLSWHAGCTLGGFLCLFLPCLSSDSDWPIIQRPGGGRSLWCLGAQFLQFTQTSYQKPLKMKIPMSEFPHHIIPVSRGHC